MMPIQIWSYPIWWQFVGDTLPEMLFASAWTLLVSFFVQLVGIATGAGSDTSPGIVIQATAYVVYILLISTQLWNTVATVLLYALLCCIYAALFGTVAFFCPRLLALLQPSLVRHSGLAIRLAIVTMLCMTVFLARTIGYARLVVAPPKEVYWWWKYGALELVPSVIFLLIMSPSSNKARETTHDVQDAHPNQKPVSNLKRSDSASSAASSRRYPEGTALLKPTSGYGATSETSNN